MPVRIAPEELPAARPDLTSTMRLDTLEGPVEVFRDPWGIPHTSFAAHGCLLPARKAGSCWQSLRPLPLLPPA